MIAEIETDKATMEVEAVDEGVLGKILVADGTAGVKVNAPIAVLVGEGESAEAPPAGAAANGACRRGRSTPARPCPMRRRRPRPRRPDLPRRRRTLRM